MSNRALLLKINWATGAMSINVFPVEICDCPKISTIKLKFVWLKFLYTLGKSIINGFC